MSLSDSITYTLAAGSDSVSASQSKSAGQRVTIDETLAIGTDSLVALNIDISQLSSVFILSDTACTLETNSGSAADYTITLVAGVPLVWQAGTYHANPFSADITALYVTNAAQCRLRAWFLIDPTV